MELLEEVKENLSKLENCTKPHDFSIDMDKKKPFNKRYVCTKCGGYVWQSNKIWYERGLSDSKIIK